MFSLLAAGTASASDPLPAKVVRMVIGFPAGGPVDILARVITQRVAEGIGQQVIVDSRPGANGNIAAELVARAPADGHTLMLVASSFATNHHLYPKLPVHPMRDFAPVSLVSAAPLILVAHPSVPARNLEALIALARARPGQLDCSVAGRGSGGHLTVELLKSMAGIDVLVIPHKGGAAAVADTIGGQVHLTVNNALAVLPHVRNGRLRALGITSLQRIAVAPEIPTVAESGLPGFESSLWYGIVGPAKLPAQVIARLNGEVVRTTQLPAVRDRLIADGMEVIGSTPEAFGAFIQRESDKWGRVIGAARIRVD
jgi:tripartite-type tricarboxylate transporter receptor subunit TctC